MSCYSKHPDKPDVECWHGPGHRGDHGKEDKSWPNLDDPLRIELKRLDDENERLRADVDKTQNEFARSARAWTAERDKLMADALMRQTTEITLRADLAAMTASFDEAAGHLTRLMDERAECLALLSGLGYQATDYCDGAEEGEDMSEECYDETPCWAHRAAVLLSKLRGQP